MNNSIVVGIGRAQRRAPVGDAYMAGMEELEGRRLLAAAAGALDPGFGRTGVVELPAQRAMRVRTVGAAALPGGKTLMLGSTPASGGRLEPVLARIDVDGTPDATFGDDGVLVLTGSRRHPLPQDGLPSALAVDGAGRMYVARGHSALRLSPDGTLDTSFGRAGFARLSLQIETMTIGPDGSVYVAGTFSSDLTIERLTADGITAERFGNRGLASVTLRRGGSHLASCAHALLVQDDGRILVGGGEDGYFDLVRFNADGSLDHSFGVGGGVRVLGNGLVDNLSSAMGSPGGPWFASLAVRASDGMIFAGGGYPQGSAYSNGGDKPLVVASFTRDGRANRSFGSGGWVTAAVGRDAALDSGYDVGAMATGVTPLADGRVLVTGFCFGHSAGENGAVVARLNADGTGDATFGAALPAVAGASAAAVGLRVLPTRQLTAGFGDLSVARWTSSPIVGSDGGFLIPLEGGTPKTDFDELTALRFNADGSLDRQFGRNGVATASKFEADSTRATSVVPGMDGVAYTQVQGDADRTFVTRVAANGGRQRGWREVLRGDLAGALRRPLAVTSDGKLLVEELRPGAAVAGGFFAQLSSYVSRYNADGTLDTSFGTGGFVELGGATPPYYGRSIGKLLVRPDGSMVADVSTVGPPIILETTDTSDALFAIDATGHVTGTYAVAQTISGTPPYDDHRSNYTEMALTANGDVMVALKGADPVNGGSATDNYLLRLDGTSLAVDATFGNGGSLPVPSGFLGGSSSLSVSSLASRPGGGFVVGATVGSASLPALPSYLLELNEDGSLDPAFGSGGAVAMPVSTRTGPGQWVVQQDGRVVMETGDSHGVVRLTRLNADGSIDGSFGTGGVAPLLGVAANHDVAIALQETADGERLLVAGDTPADSTVLHDPSDATPTVAVVVAVEL